MGFPTLGTTNPTCKSSSQPGQAAQRRCGTGEHHSGRRQITRQAQKRSNAKQTAKGDAQQDKKKITAASEHNDLGVARYHAPLKPQHAVARALHRSPRQSPGERCSPSTRGFSTAAAAQNQPRSQQEVCHLCYHRYHALITLHHATLLYLFLCPKLAHGLMLLLLMNNHHLAIKQ